MPKQVRIIYLCTSNVCRSPVAEAIARDYIASNGIKDIEVVSRGVTDQYSPWGSPAEPRMLKAASSRVNPNVLNLLQTHQARKLKGLKNQEDDLSRKDVDVYIFLVTSDHFDWARDAIDKVGFDEAVKEGRVNLVRLDKKNIKDPYFGQEQDYNEVCDVLVRTVVESLQVVLERREKEKK